jgi:hypothetical protein
MNESPRENIRERRLENFWKKLKALKEKKIFKKFQFIEP